MHCKSETKTQVRAHMDVNQSPSISVENQRFYVPKPQISHLYRSANLFICSQLSNSKNSSSNNDPLKLRRCYRAPIYGYIVTLSSPNDAISCYSLRTPATGLQGDPPSLSNIHSIHAQGLIALHRLFLLILTTTKTRTRTSYSSSISYIRQQLSTYPTSLPTYLPR
jgi:hypothetical protein